MDKLRGMEYLVRVVEARSFAAAARQLDVSPPAVTQMIAALENDLGTTLLHRGRRGVSPTRDGEHYYATCVNMLAELRAAEAHLRGSRTDASGKLVVGMSRIIARNCIMPVLPALLSRHPGLALDVRSVQTTEEPLASLVDVLVINAWHLQEDMIERHLAQTRYMTCASPSYWRAHGIAKDPDELRAHACLAYRSSRGPAVVEWRYRRGGRIRTVAVKPHVLCDDRDANIEAALAGVGILRTPDLTIWPWLDKGLLVPVLNDWEGLDAPPIRLLYRRGSGSSARVRAFSSFAVEVFERLKAARRAAGFADPPVQPVPTWWHRTRFGKAPARRALSH